MLGNFFIIYTAIALNKFICFLCNNLKVLIKMHLLRFESSIKYKLLKYFESEI